MQRHRSVGSALFCGRATLYALAAYHMLRTPVTLASLPKGEWRSFMTVYIDSGRCVCAAQHKQHCDARTSTPTPTIACDSDSVGCGTGPSRGSFTMPTRRSPPAGRFSTRYLLTASLPCLLACGLPVRYQRRILGT